MQELGERVFRIDAVDPEEARPEAELSSPSLGLMEIDRDYAVIPRKPERRPAAALRSLGALVRAWERGDLTPK